MSRVLLVSSNLTVDPFPVYPLGMAVVAAGLAARGHEVEQFDFLASGASEEAFTERIRASRPEFIGISMRNLDTCDSLTFEDYPAITRRLVALARTATSAPIILGGPAFSILPEVILDYTDADYGVVGEGEVLAADLVEALAAGKPMPRILRGEGRLEAGAIAAPRYDPELVAYYHDRSSLINVQSRRGCPFHCIYCNYPTLEGREYRQRDAKAVADDLDRLKAEHGVGHFFFADSVFNDTEGHHLEVAEELIRRDLGITWTCYMRPQDLTVGDLRLMKRAGLKAVELGTDAASDTTLKGLGKGFTFDEVVRANEAFIEAEVPCAHFVMFGGPGETEATVQEGLANLQRLKHTVVFAFSGIRIFPGTPLHVLALREGRLSPEDDLRLPVYYHARGLDPEVLYRMLEEGFRGRRDRFFPPERGRERMEVLQAMGFRGQLWDTLIRFPATSPSPRENRCH